MILTDPLKNGKVKYLIDDVTVAIGPIDGYITITKNLLYPINKTSLNITGVYVICDGGYHAWKCCIY